MALCASLFVFAAWRSGRPADPARVRMIPWMMIVIICGAVFMLLLAHVFNLFGIETGGGLRRF